MGQSHRPLDRLAIMWQDRSLTPGPATDARDPGLFFGIEDVAARRCHRRLHVPGQAPEAAAAEWEALGVGEQVPSETVRTERSKSPDRVF